MFQNWETFIGVIVGLAILIPYLLKKFYCRAAVSGVQAPKLADASGTHK